MLSEAVAQEKRPLSWVIGPQGVVKGEKPVMRDQKRAERMSSTVLRPPDEV